MVATFRWGGESPSGRRTVRFCSGEASSVNGGLIALTVVLLAFAGPSAAQLPGTDIWLADLRIHAGGVEIGAPVNATPRSGYDNQPFFLPDGGFLYSAADTASSTDVWRWDGGVVSRVTRTPESEYSPTPLPAGGAFCAVRVESGGAQRLWRFDADGGGARLLMADVDSVGYFEWLDESTLAVFVVGQPHTLRIVEVATQRETVVARDIGRFIRRVPATRDVTFTMRGEDGAHRFFVLPFRTEAPSPLIDGVGGEDAVWAGEVLLATGGDAIFAARPLRASGWTRVADLADRGLAGASRLAVDPTHTRLAVVCAE